MISILDGPNIFRNTLSKIQKSTFQNLDSDRSLGPRPVPWWVGRLFASSFECFRGLYRFSGVYLIEYKSHTGKKSNEKKYFRFEKIFWIWKKNIFPLLYLDWMVVKVRYVRSAPVTNTLAQVREKSSIFPHTHVMFAPVTNALDTLLTYVAVQGYLALHRYIHWVWRRKLAYYIH